MCIHHPSLRAPWQKNYVAAGMLMYGFFLIAGAATKARCVCELIHLNSSDRIVPYIILVNIWYFWIMYAANPPDISGSGDAGGRYFPGFDFSAFRGRIFLPR